MSVADRAAVHDLLVSYFGGFDERRPDEAFLTQIFTADAHWRFPRGDATGIKEIIERRDGTLGLWKQTLHSVSSVLIQLNGDRASFTATLLASPATAAVVIAFTRDTRRVSKKVRRSLRSGLWTGVESRRRRPDGARRLPARYLVSRAAGLPINEIAPRRDSPRPAPASP
jgi:hypothetical protein